MATEHFVAMNKIYDLFEANVKLISKKHMGLNPAMGRYHLIQEMFQCMQDCEADDVRLQSIVEKHGRMDIYYEGGDDKLYDDIKDIMDRSIRGCLICGAARAEGHPVRCETHLAVDATPSTLKQMAELDKRMKSIARRGSPEFEF